MLFRSVDGDDLDGDAVTGDSDTITVDVLHDAGTLSIVKTSDKAAYAHGETITYTYTVTYVPGTDGSPAQNIAVSDTDEYGSLTISALVSGDTDSDGYLDGTETWVYNATRVLDATHANDDHLDIDGLTNTASVDGDDLDGDAVTGDSDTLTVDVLHDAGALTIVKTSDKSAYAHGETITYSYAVTYVAGADMSPAQNIVVTDTDEYGSLTEIGRAHV